MAPYYLDIISILYIFSFHSDSVRAVSRWNLPAYPAPPFIENFDPALANPAGALVCNGPPPSFRLPWRGDWDPNQATLLEICAKPQYGGHPVGPAPNFARGDSAYCIGADTIPDIGIGFDNNVEAYPDNSRSLMNGRLRYYCLLRCRCRIEGDPNRYDGELPIPRIVRPYIIELDKNDDFERPGRHIRRFSGLTRALTLAAQTMVMEGEWEDAHPEEDAQLHADDITPVLRSRWQNSYVAVHPVNRVQCTGEPPTFPYPEGLNAEALGIEDAQTACAPELLGGHNRANAGAYCHRHDADNWDRTSEEERLQSLWFSPEMAPSELFTLRGNVQFAAQLQYYCWQHCRCPYDRRKKREKELDSLGEIFLLFKNLGIVGTRGPNIAFMERNIKLSEERICRLADASSPGGRRCQYSPTKSGGGRSRQLPIIPGTTLDAQGKTVDCGLPGTSACPPRPWPTSLLGPAPGASPPDPPAPGRQSSSPARLDDILGQPARKELTCGTKCSGPAAKQCSGYNSDSMDCKCVTVTPILSDLLGRGARALLVGGSYCLSFGAIATILDNFRRVGPDTLTNVAASRLIIGGRSVDDYPDFDVPCACNGTYSGPACCDSQTGMVWA